MTVAARRITLSAVALALLAPGPLLAGAPDLSLWSSARVLGAPVSIFVGLCLLLALVLLAWAYAGLSLDGEVDRG